jgi:hypothetical protein
MFHCNEFICDCIERCVFENERGTNHVLGSLRVLEFVVSRFHISSHILLCFRIDPKNKDAGMSQDAGKCAVQLKLVSSRKTFSERYFCF